jgi:SAM-dependent methyltransferase
VNSNAKARWRQDVARYDIAHLRLRLVGAIVRQLKPALIIDLGCASGKLRHLCTESRYIGIDFVAPSEPVDFEFHECDFNVQPLPAGILADVIVCSGILEYMEDLDSFLQKTRSCLSPGGHLVATYFNMNHISRVISLLAGNTIHMHPDWRGFFSPRTIQKKIADAGFSIQRVVPLLESLGAPSSVEETQNQPVRLLPMRRRSYLLAHQFIFVAGLDNAL